MQFEDAKGNPVRPGISGWEPVQPKFRCPCVAAEGLTCLVCVRNGECGELVFEVD